jgi:hypothetical protein
MVKPDAGKSAEEVVAEQHRALETRIEVGTSLQRPPNQTVQFPKPDHPVSLALGQKKTSRTTAPRMASASRWCPPSLMPCQRRRIQWMRVLKMKEEATEKERDEYFNTIHPVILRKQEWRVKEKVDTPAPTTSDDDMDLLSNDEAPLIKDGSPLPTGMDINMVFTLPAEFRGVEEEVTYMCLSPKEAMFEKPKESR